MINDISAPDFEGFPMTLVEAQQMGCVPIAFDSFDSLSEVIYNGRNGVIVPNNEKNKYIEAALSLMTNPVQRRQMATQATTDCKQFSQDEICSIWKKELESIV